MPSANPPRSTCLIYCPLPYAGHGWPQTCIGVAANFSSAGIRPVLVTPRLRKQLPPTMEAVEGLRFPLSGLPWKLVRHAAGRRLDDIFARLLRQSDPRSTIAYFWPGTPPHLVELARETGIVSLREMINTYQGTAKRILDAAYDRLQLPRSHPVTQAAAEDERKELLLYDHVFAPSREVEKSLHEAGVRKERIVATSYGWFPGRFAQAGSGESGQRPFRALFAGLICVRKGVPELLEAWARSGVAGELVLVGDVEPVLRRRLAAAMLGGRVRHVAHTSDIGAYYRNADLFVFPSLEEGCPQVTMEAGGCGLPVIATPMGAGRLVKNGINGLIVAPGDVDGLAAALRLLAQDEPLRRRFADRIARDAQRFTYDRVSAARSTFMADLLRDRQGPQPAGNASQQSASILSRAPG